MGLIATLCDEMCISQEMLATIVGVPAECMPGWRATGVPLARQSDFRVLEDLLSEVRGRSPLPVRGAIRVRVPDLAGASVLDLLAGEGAVVALRRVREARHLHPVWAADGGDGGGGPRPRRRTGRAA